MLVLYYTGIGKGIGAYTQGIGTYRYRQVV